MRTAVTFIISQMSSCNADTGGGGNWYITVPHDTIKKALEMEKQQIMAAYLENHKQACWMDKTENEYAEDYYNETFKSEE